MDWGHGLLQSHGVLGSLLCHGVPPHNRNNGRGSCYCHLLAIQVPELPRTEGGPGFHGTTFVGFGPRLLLPVSASQSIFVTCKESRPQSTEIGHVQGTYVLKLMY